MEIRRRAVLKGMALSSLAGLALNAPLRAFAMGGSVAAPGIQRSELLVLVGEGAASAAFLHGVAAAQSATPRVLDVGQDLGFMLDFERQLGSGVPARLIGLLDDASATLIVDLARSGGARAQWLGQHTAEAGASHHHLLSTEAAAGCSQWFGEQLHACGAAFTLAEERQGQGGQSGQINTLTAPAHSAVHSAQWASSVGYLLAALGTDIKGAPPVVPLANMPLAGSFVSFSIEV